MRKSSKSGPNSPDGRSNKQLVEELKRELRAFEDRQWHIGDLLVLLVNERKMTLKELAKESGYEQPSLSNFKLAAEAFPPGTRTAKYTWRKHHLARMGAKTVERERGTTINLHDALDLVGPKSCREAKDAAKIIRAGITHKWNVGEPEVREGMDQVVHGDALAVATTTADAVEAGEIEPFALAVFSPPYCHATLYKEYSSKIQAFKTFDDWLTYQEQLANQLRRLLYDWGVVFINTDDLTVENALKWRNPDLRRPVLEKISSIYRSLGFSYRDRFIWAKQECVGDHHMIGGVASPRVNNAFEDLTAFQRNSSKLELDRVSICAETRKAWLTGGVWSFMPETKKSPCPFPYPEELSFRAISLYTGIGQSVFCPFAGSGTDCVVAKKLNRRFIGVELDDDTCAYAQKRVAATKVGDSVKRSPPTILGLPVDPEMKRLLEEKQTRRRKGKGQNAA